MTGKTKHPIPAWAGCLLLIALTIVGTLRFWRPVTAQSGEEYHLRLERAWMHGKSMYLDFGISDNFRMPQAGDLDALLEPDAVGKEYRVIADYHARRRGSDYYDVYALNSADGTQYLTIEQSEARRQELLPLRLTLFAVLDVICCVIVICAEHRRRKAAQTAPSAPDDPEEEEESP